jgi:glutamyl-tRNA reductase
MKLWKIEKTHSSCKRLSKKLKSSTWTGRKFAPTINALKAKLNAIKASELDFQSKKISNFNEEQAEIISNRIIQNYNPFCQSFKDDNTMVDESIEWIEKVFKIGATAK